MKKTEFSTAVEKFAREGNLTLLESIMAITDHLAIDPENVPKMITKSLYDKLEAEAIEYNYIKNEGKSCSLSEIFPACA